MQSYVPEEKRNQRGGLSHSREEKDTGKHGRKWKCKEDASVQIIRRCVHTNPERCNLGKKRVKVGLDVGSGSQCAHL